VTSIGNVVYGGGKVAAGGVLLLFGSAAEVTGISSALGVSAEVAGAYEIVTGGARILRGGKQFVSAIKHPLVRQTPVRFAERVAFDLGPFGSQIEDVIGGLP
jgi:hypothetical protein